MRFRTLRAERGSGIGEMGMMTEDDKNIFRCFEMIGP